VQFGKRRLLAEAEVTAAGLGFDVLARRRHLDHGEIALFETALRLWTIRAGLLANAIDHVADVGIADFDFRIIDGQPAVFAEIETRLYFEFVLVFDRRAFDERIHVLQVRLTDDVQTFIGDRVVKRQRNSRSHHLLLDLLGERVRTMPAGTFPGRKPGFWPDG